MARRGFGGTALRAALGAVTGVAEGMRLREEREFEREKEKAAAARQAMLDAAALRGEERAAAAAGMIPATQYTGLSPFDMPGATPRQPLLRQTIGGRELVLPEAPKMAEHRAGVAKTIGERKEKERESAELGELYEGLEVGGRRILQPGQGRRLAMAPTNTQSSVIGAAARLAEAQLRPTRGGGGTGSLDTGERALLSQAQTNARNSADEFQRTLRDRPQQKDFVNPLTKKPDKAAFAEATQKWAAGDSTFAAQRMAADQAELERLKADLGVAAPAAPAAGRGGRLPTGDAESQLSARAQQKIAEIQDSDHTPEEKQQKIQQVNAILAREIAKIRGAGR